MKVLCETIFEEMLPALRSIITNELIKTYGLTQEQAAKKLGVTQPAVSQYLSGLRGKRVQQITSNPKLMEWVKKLSSEIASGSMDFNENFCEICKGLRKENMLQESK